MGDETAVQCERRLREAMKYCSLAVPRVQPSYVYKQKSRRLRLGKRTFYIFHVTIVIYSCQVFIFLVVICRADAKSRHAIASPFAGWLKDAVGESGSAGILPACGRDARAPREGDDGRSACVTRSCFAPLSMTRGLTAFLLRAC